MKTRDHIAWLERWAAWHLGETGVFPGADTPKAQPGVDKSGHLVGGPKPAVGLLFRARANRLRAEDKGVETP